MTDSILNSQHLSILLKTIELAARYGLKEQEFSATIGRPEWDTDSKGEDILLTYTDKTTSNEQHKKFINMLKPLGGNAERLTIEGDATSLLTILSNAINTAPQLRVRS